ncbi:MAG: flippase-like domain-containing protein [Methylotenera sp.]|nr:flippase-like domain-containing protein [Oligoflexia bacterium]
MKKLVSLALKILFVAVVFYLLGKKGLISVGAFRRALDQPGRIVPAVSALVVCMFLSAIRWQWLLQAQNIHLRWVRTFQLVFIGQFFNIALPGAVSGDFVKAFYVSNEIQGQRARAFGSILFDRIVGLSALVLVSAGALISHLSSFLGTAFFSAIQAFVGTAAVCVVIFYGYLFFVREDHDPILKILNQLHVRFPKVASLTRIYEGTRHYHHHRATVFKALLISIMIHLSVGFACIQFAYAMGETQLEPLSMLVIIPLGLLATAIPVLPAGVGTGHAAFAGLFHLLGSARGADIFSFYVLVQLFLGAAGGLVYLRFKTEKLPAPDFKTASSSA